VNSQKIRVLINGFGRIGRSAARIMLDDSAFELIAINDLYSYEQMAYLLKYDSIYGTLKHDVNAKGNRLFVNSQEIKFFSEKNPANIDIKPLDIDIVLQCTGVFLTKESNIPFIENGAKKVLVSAPASDDMLTYIYGVNHKEYKHEDIISSSSCSANAIVPIFKIIDKHFGIESAMMSMYHSYTAYQHLLDNAHHSEDIRRTRSATQNIIPLVSSAAQATSYFFPKLKEKLYARSIRIPISSTTLYDLSIKISKVNTEENINQILKKEISTSYTAVLDTRDEVRESSDFIQNPHSAVVNLAFTKVAGDLLKVSAWQDNEYGYAKRLVDMAKYIS